MRVPSRKKSKCIFPSHWYLQGRVTKGSVPGDPEAPDHLISQNQMLQHLPPQIVSHLGWVQAQLASANF